MCAAPRPTLSHQVLVQIKQDVEAIAKIQSQSGGRTYLHISRDLSKISSTDNPEEASDFAQVSKFVHILQKLKVSPDDAKLLSEIFKHVKEVSEAIFPDQKEKIAELFKSNLRENQQDPKTSSLKKSNLYLYFHSGRKKHMDAQIEKGMKAGLNEFEALGAYFYTTDAYKILNAYMRGQDSVMEHEITQLYEKLSKEMGFMQDLKREFTSKYGSMGPSKEQFMKDCKAECILQLQALKNGLSALPKAKVERLYRGDLLSDEEAKLIASGKYSDKGVMSFSRNELESRNWAIRDPRNELEKHHVLVIVEKSTQGRDVKSISSNPKENEVLFLPDQEFEVVKVTPTMLGNFKGAIILLKEK